MCLFLFLSLSTSVTLVKQRDVNVFTVSHCVNICLFELRKPLLIFFSSQFCPFSILPCYIFPRDQEAELFLAPTALVRIWCVLDQRDLRAHLVLGDQWGLFRARTQQQGLSCLCDPHIGSEGLVTLKTPVAVESPHGHVWKTVSSNWGHLLSIVFCYPQFPNLGGLVRTQIAGPHPGVADPVGLGQELIPGSTLWGHLFLVYWHLPPCVI